MDQSKGFVSVYEIIEDAMDTFNVDVPVSSMIRWVARGLELLGSFEYSEDVVAIIDVEDYKGILPCDILYINQVRTNDKNKRALRSTTNSFHTSNDTNSQLISSNLEYQTNMDHIITSFKSGQLEMNYRRIPVDEKGYPMIPNDPSFKEALKYHLLYKVAEKLFSIKKITADIFTHYKDERNWYMAQAQSKSKLPTHDQMESIANSFMRLVSNPLAHSKYFKDQSLPQQFKTHPR